MPGKESHYLSSLKYIPCIGLKSHIVLQGRNIAFCCVESGRKSGPRWEWAENGTESMEAFLMKRDELCQELNGMRPINLLRPCVGCPKLIENTCGTSVTLEKISHLNYGYVPTICQCKCIYCKIAECKDANDYQLAKNEKFAEKLFDAIDYLEKNDYLADNFHIKVASGEITVHPERDVLMRLLVKYPCHWYTNAFIYSQAIASNMHSNPSSMMCVSIDCGTAETFRRIKGYDLFDKVIENLARYNEHGFLRLKYIILPGINDSISDFNGIIALLKRFEHSEMVIARDSHIFPLPHEVFESTALLKSMCKKHGIKLTSYMFTKNENDEIQKLADRGFENTDIERYEKNHMRQYFINKKLTNDNFDMSYRLYSRYRLLEIAVNNLKELLNGRKGVVIWGAGLYGRLLIDFINRNDFNSQFYLTDIDKLKHGTVVLGKEVTGFKELEDKVDTIILSNSSFKSSVKSQIGSGYEIIDIWAFVEQTD